MKHMFSNIGGKIKAAAKVMCWFMIGASVIGGIAMTRENFFVGLVIMVVGALMGWVGSFAMYALGEITENSCVQAEILVKWDMEREKNK